MSKLILTSMMFATVCIPTLAASNKNPRKGLSKAIKQTLLFDVFYAFALIFLWGRC